MFELNSLALKIESSPILEVTKLHRSPGRPVDQALKGVILDAISIVLAKDGYRNLTIGKVAQTAAVSTATVYRRWPTKQAMFFDAIRQWGKSLVTEINTGSFWGDIDEFIEIRARFLATPIGQTYGILMGESVQDPEFGAVLKEVSIDPAREQINIIINRAVDKQEMNFSDFSDVFFDVLFSTIHFRSIPIFRDNFGDVESNILKIKHFMHLFLKSYVG